MITIQRVATTFGAVFVLVGALGFTATGMAVTMGDMRMSAEHAPLLLGLFPVNALHNGVHLLFGLWGLWAGRGAGRAVAYALGSGAAYLLLAVVGLLTPTLIGILPIGGYDVGLHFLVGVLLAGFGFWASWAAAEVPEVRPATRSADG